jgi:hypothetical protein
LQRPRLLEPLYLALPDLHLSHPACIAAFLAVVDPGVSAEQNSACDEEMKQRFLQQFHDNVPFCRIGWSPLDILSDHGWSGGRNVQDERNVRASVICRGISVFGIWRTVAKISKSSSNAYAEYRQLAHIVA